MSTCSLAFTGLPIPNKEGDQNRIEIPPSSLTYDQAVSLIINTDHWPGSLQILTDRFDSDLSNLESGRISNETFLENFFTIFNTTFFFDLVRNDLCRLRFIPISNPNWITNFERESGRFNACTNHYRYGSIISKITLFERDIPDCKARSLAHLGTLAHDMIHSFFHIYAYRCEEKCKALWKEKNGATDHGILWHRCALKIEKSLKEALGNGIHLSRAVVMGKELAWRNAWTSSMPLVELSLSVAEVERKRIEDFGGSDVQFDDSSDTVC